MKRWYWKKKDIQIPVQNFKWPELFDRYITYIWD